MDKSITDNIVMWRTQDGVLLHFHQMTTTHLFYSMRMVWNHTVPTQCQLPGGRYQIQSLEKRQEALRYISHELSKPHRIKELEKHKDLWDQLCYMAQITKEIDLYAPNYIKRESSPHDSLEARLSLGNQRSRLQRQKRLLNNQKGV